MKEKDERVLEYMRQGNGELVLQIFNNISLLHEFKEKTLWYSYAQLFFYSISVSSDENLAK